MERSTNINEYAKLNIKDLLNVISSNFYDVMSETFATVNLQLETAHKLEPNEEELEFALATLKLMEQKFLQHIEKEQKLLFPLFSVSKRRMQLKEEEEKDLSEFISKLKLENFELKKQMAQIKKVTNNYDGDPSFTPSHKLAYAQLNDLEQDINRLFFVEEQYLYPRALQLNQYK